MELQDITTSVPSKAGKIIQVLLLYKITNSVTVPLAMQVSAGCGHSGFITENGHAFTFGDDRYNQLGERVCM